MIEEKRLYQKPKIQWLPKSAPDLERACFSAGRKEVHEGRSAVSDDRHGFLGKSRAQTKIQEKYQQHGGDRAAAQSVCGFDRGVRLSDAENTG